jgi:hypothetical protein
MQIGSLAEWVSGLATAGSLFLGFTILWRDRRKSDAAEATQVVAWFVNHPDGSVELRITNGASRPIVHVIFHLASTDEQGKQAALWRMINVAAVLASNESSSLTIPFREFHANSSYPSYVQFRDANGVSWRRNVRSGRLRRTKVRLNWKQRLALMKSPRRAITRIRVSHRNWQHLGRGLVLP